MSLRRATVLSLTVALSALGIVGGIAAYLSASSEAAAFLDQQQAQIARYVGDLSAVVPADASLAPHDPEDDFVVVVTYADGRVNRSISRDIHLPKPEHTGFSAFDDGKRSWRVYALVTPDRSVQVAQQVVVRRELAQEAAFRATLPFALAIPLTWLVVELVARHIFRRLGSVASSMARREAHDLSPLPAGQVPDEVRPLVNALNDLLGRLRLALSRQQAFLADAAHELRTPLTALTLQIANLRQAAPDAALDGRLLELEAGARRASALTRQLLGIARYDAASDRPPPVPVRIDEAVLDVVAGLVPLADARGIDLGVAHAQAATVLGERGDLRTLVEILVDNAVRYTPRGGMVDVTLRAAHDRTLLTVADDGPGVPDDALPRLRERFFRAAPAETEGSGMGLAIAQAIATRHGIALQLANRTDGPGFLATLVFPGQVTGDRARAATR